MPKKGKGYIVRERDAGTGKFVKNGTNKKKPGSIIVDKMKKKK